MHFAVEPVKKCRVPRSAHGSTVFPVPPLTATGPGRQTSVLTRLRAAEFSIEYLSSFRVSVDTLQAATGRLLKPHKISTLGAMRVLAY